MQGQQEVGIYTRPPSVVDILATGLLVQLVRDSEILDADIFRSQRIYVFELQCDGVTLLHVA